MPINFGVDEEVVRAVRPDAYEHEDGVITDARGEKGYGLNWKYARLHPTVAALDLAHMRVVDIFPGAYAWDTKRGGFDIIDTNDRDRAMSVGYGKTEASAWIDAASRQEPSVTADKPGLPSAADLDARAEHVQKSHKSVHVAETCIETEHIAHVGHTLLPVQGGGERCVHCGKDFPEAASSPPLGRVNVYDKSHPLHDLEGWIVFYAQQAQQVQNDPAMSEVFQASCETSELLLELKERRAAPPLGAETKVTGASLIEMERLRQVESEGWTPEHDDKHVYGVLAKQAAALAVAHTDAEVLDDGEDCDYWGLIHKHKANTIRSLTIAGALIAAEIDRLLRMSVATETIVDQRKRERMSTPIEETLEERGKKYGNFVDHAFITQGLKRTMHDTPKWETLPPDMKECLEMIAHKVGRILNGDPFYHDSWHDIVGYTKLVADRLEGVSR